ncbi:MAG: biotin--[acetyl-CoA-carboxylase] ligase [Flavobacteriales bacterium]
MNIIKLHAIDSTNTFLLSLSKENVLDDRTIVLAKYQTNGKGQMGTLWQTEGDKNLTFSLFKRFEGIEVQQQFYISKAVSLGIFKALQSLGFSNISIKWPNDIMADSKKIAGILIENQLKNKKITSAVIGVGLNVNQKKFNNLPNASSLYHITHKEFLLEAVFEVLIQHILEQLKLLELKQFATLKRNYELVLFRKDKVSAFEDIEKNRFNGIIKGVNKEGALLVLLENDIEKSFLLKELKMLFL